MNGPVEQILTQTLATEERLAPDLNDVREGITRGVRRRRQRQHVGYALAGAATVLALVTSGVVVRNLVIQRADTAATIPTGVWQRTIHLGWLPADGLTPGGWHASTTGEGTLFPMTEGNYRNYLRVDVSNAAWEPQLDHQGWQPTLINGRPGRIVSRPTRTIIDWKLPSSRWAEIELGRGRPGAGNAQPGIQLDAERIAAAVTEVTGEPLRVKFGLTYLPARLHIVGVQTNTQADGRGTIDAVDGTQKVLHTLDYQTKDGIPIDAPTLDERTRLSVRYEPRTDITSILTWATRIDDIQGRPAYSLNHGQEVIVVGLPHGDLTVTNNGPVMVDTTIGTPEPSLAQLINVAKGVRWLG